MNDTIVTRSTSGISSLSGITRIGAGFDGQIDNVFIFDEVLSQQQVIRIRASGAAAVAAFIPEPSGLTLLGLGMRSLFTYGRRQNAVAEAIADQDV